MILILSTSGCSIGVKEIVRPIYCGFAKTPLELKGAVRIATNRKIKVTVVSKTDVDTEMDLGGMIAVRSVDLAELIRRANGKK